MTNDFMEMAVEICRQMDKEQRLCLLMDSNFTQKWQDFKMKTFTAFDLAAFRVIAKTHGFEISSWRIAGTWQTDEIQVSISYLGIPVKNGEREL